MGRRRGFVTVLALTVAIGTAFPASADEAAPDDAARLARAEPAPLVRSSGFTLDRSDGEDSKSKLDLASVTITQGARSKDSVRFSTHERVANKTIVPPRGNFAVLINTNDSPRFEYGQYVFYASGRVRGILVLLKTGKIVDRSAPTSRVNNKTFKTVVQRTKIRSPGTYRLAVTSYSEGSPCSSARACIDVLPNRVPLLAVDHTAPTVELSVGSGFSSFMSVGLTFSVDVAVEDDRFGVGYDSWTVEVSEDGGAWTAIDEGSSATAHVEVMGQEGSTYRIRASAIDGQENQATGDIESVLVPFDDDWASATYSSSDWSTPAANHAFLGSMHLSVAVDESDPPPEPVEVTGTFTGTQLCVSGGDPSADGGAAFAIDGLPAGGFDQDPTSFMGGELYCSSTVASGTHPFAVTVAREVVAIDGFYVIA
jgi:hypothetical protein